MEHDPTLSVESAGRNLNIWTTKENGGTPLVFHFGSPGPPVEWPALETAAANNGFKLVTYARPGYSGSSRHPGRCVADAAADTAAVLDALGEDEYLVAGWSGGGPHALACAALHSDRCLGVASLAGVVPFDAPDIQFTAGMADENVEEFELAARGEDELRPYLEAFLEGAEHVTGDEVAEALGGLISDVDRAALTSQLSEVMANLLRRTARDGLYGWLDDDLAFAKPWGFELETVQAPVAVWQGRQDRMVPYAHGEWLVANIPDARARLSEEEGHISLVGQLETIITDLANLAGP